MATTDRSPTPLLTDPAVDGSSVPVVPVTTLSDAASLNRGRGLSTSSGNRSLSVAPQKSVRGPSPRDHVSTSFGPSPDAAPVERSRRPSLPYNHLRQPSHAREPTLPRSSSHATLRSESTSPSKSPVAAVLIRENSRPKEDAEHLKARLNDVANAAAQLNGSLAASPLPTTPSPIPGNRAAADDIRRIERLHSSKTHRDPHLRSYSRQPGLLPTASPSPQESKSVSEYALHHLFNSFVQEAEHKIAQCLATSISTSEPDIEPICAAGEDPKFDQLLQAMGYVSRMHPRFLIISARDWSKKSSTSHKSPGSKSPPGETFQSRRTPNSSYDPEVVMQDRRAKTANYLYCRVVLATLAQTDSAAIAPILDSLEESVYRTLRAFTQEVIDRYPIRRAIFKINCQLVAMISDLSFDGLSKKLLNDLADWQKILGEKGYTDRAAEAEMVLILKAMRSLRLQVSTAEKWAESCHFLQSVAQAFSTVHGQAPKVAFCRFFEAVLLPVASKWTKETTDPAWRRTVRLISDRVTPLAAKPKYWSQAASLQTALMCASPVDIFTSKWHTLLAALQAKLKEPRNRSTALKLISRLVWSYLLDHPDSQHSTNLNLNDIIHSVFFPGRKVSLTTEPGGAEPLIQIIRIIGHKNLALCCRAIVFPLINSELFTTAKDPKHEQLEPTRMVLGIKAFLAIMNDMERKERPPFPIKFADDTFEVPLQEVPVTPIFKKDADQQASKIRDDRLAKPVDTTDFSEPATEFYNRFCGILGRITLMCDNLFGGQAVLEERFAITTPKTPVSDAFGNAFNRKDEHVSSDEIRRGFYDLLHVAVQALPRFMSADIPFNSLVNLLCTGTAHPESNIAFSSSKSLKAIARQAHAQQVITGFTRFIFKYNNRYGTMSDGGMLGPSHIHNTLNLYLELLRIWIEEVQGKTQKLQNSLQDVQTEARRQQLDLSAVANHVEEVEANGLFFLCSPSSRVRAIAVEVLRLVTKLDTALGQNNIRIIQLLEGTSPMAIDVNEETLTLAERTRLHKVMRTSETHGGLIELCSNDGHIDISLWNKIFPSFIHACFESCVHAVTLTRSTICERLPQVHSSVEGLDGRFRAPQASSTDLNAQRLPSRYPSTGAEMIIEQWRLYLIFASTTLVRTGPQQAVSGSEVYHARKTSKSSQTSSDSFESATDLFVKVIPMLSSEQAAIREAAARGLGSVNINLYRTLLETLDKFATGQHIFQRYASNVASRSGPRDLFRTEITHIYKATIHLLTDSASLADEWILTMLVTYTQNLAIFLMDSEIQKDFAYQRLRFHYCGLIEGVFTGINKTKEPLRWMTFQTRKAAFALLEGWCGYVPDRTSRQTSPSPDRHFDSPMTSNSQVERERKDLKIAALGAMATLCCGPVRITTAAQKSVHQFDVGRMLAWIEKVFLDPSDKYHTIGRRALKNLISHNREHEVLLDRSIDMLYRATTPKALESYLDVVCDVASGTHETSPPLWRVLCVGLYLLGDGQSSVRTKAAKLLRSHEDHQKQSAKLRELEISISDKTAAVFNKAQFEIAGRLAQEYQELAFHVLSEFCKFFKDLHPDRQRILVPAMLPWARVLELQVTPEGGPTEQSYVMLMNFFEMTARCIVNLPHEVSAFWKALVAGPYQGNVQLILDFITDLCLETKDTSFVQYSKQIIVFLSDGTTPTLPDISSTRRQKIVDFLLLNITPLTLAHYDPRKSFTGFSSEFTLPYAAEMSSIPSGIRETSFSLGHLSLIFLVDLVVSPILLTADKVLVLLQTLLVFWDHRTPFVQEQAREMLVHLVHEIIISKKTDLATGPPELAAETFVELIRQQDAKVAWTYAESVAHSDHPHARHTPEAMPFVVNQVVNLFQTAYPDFRDLWGKTALSWATNCAVHHTACRSLQLLRCVSTPLDNTTLFQIIVRLQHVIGDGDHIVTIYAVELLRTLGSFIDYYDGTELLQFPMLFWAIYASLDTPNEFEFLETLILFEKYLDKVDLGDTEVLDVLHSNSPTAWEGVSRGISDSVFIGCKSKLCIEPSLRVLERLALLPIDTLIGGQELFLLTCLANMPRFSHTYASPEKSVEVLGVARSLGEAAAANDKPLLAIALRDFAGGQIKSSDDFLQQVTTGIKSYYFPDLELDVLTFLMGLLTNDIAWFKTELMRFLEVILKDINLRNPQIVKQGPDLVSPLLRLLSTDFCVPALKVLDGIRTTLNATSMDVQHMRMSIGGSHSSLEFRKEHASTFSLYGIPEQSGWSVPTPALRKDLARRNMTHVIPPITHAETDIGKAETSGEFQFSVEEGSNGSYALDDRTETMTTDTSTLVGHTAGDELASRLDSLDDFFDDETPEPYPLPQSQYGYSNESHGLSQREHFYDQHTAPILYRSSNRNLSISSFHSNAGHDEMRHNGTTSLSREPSIMSPSAFAAMPRSPFGNGLPGPPSNTTPSTNDLARRPSIGGRSITSPAAPLAPRGLNTNHSFTPADLSTDEPFSDDDMSLGRISTGERPGESMSSLSPSTIAASGARTSMSRSRPSLRNGMRNGLKRLTSTERHRGGRLGTVGLGLDDSPEVPKVPDEYLRNPKSSEL